MNANYSNNPSWINLPTLDLFCIALERAEDEAIAAIDITEEDTDTITLVHFIRYDSAPAAHNALHAYAPRPAPLGFVLCSLGQGPVAAYSV